MRIDELITRLDGVKRTGPGRYIARCPVPDHNDKSPSLAITQVDEKILIHCFAGCSVSSVLDAVGLDMSDLFPPRLKIDSGKPAKFNPFDVLMCLKAEAGILALAASDCVVLGVFSPEDALRVELARTRICDAVDLVLGVKNGRTCK